MAYLQHTSWKDRPGAVVGVVAIHGLMAYALVTGLSFTKIIETVSNPDGIFVPEVPLPPPPPEPEKVVPEQKAIDPPMVVPLPPIPLPGAGPVIDSTPLIAPQPEIQPRIVPGPIPQPGIAPRPSFTPQGAKPRGNPGDWVTVNDYRSIWINREMTGVARFRLEIGASGRVEGCTITASSGHPELDAATCALVAKRAKFDPAKDDTGAKVSGTYANSVRWELPE